MFDQSFEIDAIEHFYDRLQLNRQKAEQKKQQYLEKVMQIFRDFVNKCEEQIDKIILKKINKLSHNYQALLSYLDNNQQASKEQKKLIVTQFLVKPFEKFPFSGNKNQKAFKEQYTLIEKTSLLIQQTLVESFNEQEIPNFQNSKFFQSVQNNGLGEQSLIKLQVVPHKINVQLMQQLIPLQKNIRSIKVFNDFVFLIGDDRFIQIWDLQYKVCIHKLYTQVLASVSCLNMLTIGDMSYMGIGFTDENPQIRLIRTDTWRVHTCSLIHTRTVTKILQAGDFMVSGSLDGNICLYQLDPFGCVHQSLHISSVQDIIHKNNCLYVLLKCSSICEYEIIHNQRESLLQFKRTLSSGYISMIRYTQVGNNFTGVACHIYGLSQIQITRKFKVEESNIINIAEMIADFVVVESKLTSQYFAICAFQNSSAIRIYNLKSGEAIYEVSSDYMGEVGVAGYLPKIQIAFVNGSYWLILVNQSQFQSGNTVRLYLLQI